MSAEYWRNLTWPAAPNDNDYELFAQHCHGQVLLLGSTRLLLPLATQAWDTEPVYNDSKIKTRDWFSLDTHYDTIIIDGALSFGKEFTARLLPIVLAHCDRFVARVFLRTTWPARYAVYFPRAHELNPQPQEIRVNDVYSFYVWNNKY
jgi:hypothetical protein